MKFREKIISVHDLDIKILFNNIELYIMHCYKFEGEINLEDQHKHDKNHEILIIKDGAGKLLIGNEEFKVQANSIVILPPEITHTLFSDGVITYYCLMFQLKTNNISKKALNCNIYNSEIIDLIRCISNAIVGCYEDTSLIYCVWEKIIEEFETKRIGFLINIEILILQLLVEIYRKLDSSHSIYSDAKLQSSDKFLTVLLDEYIEDNISRQIKDQEIASALNISPRHLNRQLQNICNMTVHDYVISKKLLYAKRLLENKHTTVNKIASDIGFNSTSYFSNLFKFKFGLLPLEYKKMYRN